MNKFLEMKERGETILFSELLKDIPPNWVLCELFSLPDSQHRSMVSHRGMEILKLRLEGLNQSQIAEKLNLTPGQVSYTSATIKMVSCICLYQPAHSCFSAKSEQGCPS